MRKSESWVTAVLRALPFGGSPRRKAILPANSLNDLRSSCNRAANFSNFERASDFNSGLSLGPGLPLKGIQIGASSTSVSSSTAIAKIDGFRDRNRNLRCAI